MNLGKVIFDNNKCYLKFSNSIKQLIKNNKEFYFSHFNDFENDSFNVVEGGNIYFLSYFSITEDNNILNQNTKLYIIDEYTLEFNRKLSETELLKTFSYYIDDEKILIFELFPGECNHCLDGCINISNELRRKLIYNGHRFIDEKHECFLNFHSDLINDSYLKYIKTPSIFLFSSLLHNYRYLMKVELTKEEIDFLNKNGLEIYINEPMLSSKIYFYRYDTTPILESFDWFAKKWGLNNITLFTCNYGCEDIKKYFSTVNFKCKDIHLIKSSILHNNLLGYEFNSKDIKKKFWSGNWTYRKHRKYMINYLINKDGNYSWPHKEEEFTEGDLKFLEGLIKPYSNYVYNKLIEGNKKLCIESPLFMDKEISMAPKSEIIKVVGAKFENDIESPLITSEYNPMGYNQYAQVYFSTVHSAQSSIIDFYKECFCAVITETGFDSDFGNISEKIFSSIAYKRPFILMASCGSLEYLKKLGFKTFNEFWNESYDLEKHPGKRFIKICNLIDYIDKFDIKELQELYENMESILEYNIENLKRFRYTIKSVSR
jgi:hypothetical protein